MAAFFELPLEDVQWQEGLSHSVDECPDCSGENSGVTQPKYDKTQALQIAGIQVRFTSDNNNSSNRFFFVCFKLRSNCYNSMLDSPAGG